jgi:hypothetical protein
MDRLQKYFTLYLLIAVCIIGIIGCTEVKFNNPYETGGTNPVITLHGDLFVTLIIGWPYVEKGYTASDNDGNDLTDSVTYYVVDESGTAVGIDIFTNHIGTYTIHYNVTNANRIQAHASRTVLVLGLVDLIPPVITILGKNPVEIFLGQLYEDAGATAKDSINDSTIVNLTPFIDTTTNVNPWIVGSYQVIYYVEDTAGNSDTKTRKVNVLVIPDTTPPVITMKGFDTVLVNYKGFYIDSNAVAWDDKDGQVPVIRHGYEDVNVDSLGKTFVIFYTASDYAGNEADTVRRYVIIADLEGPVIYLLGSNPKNFSVGWPYIEDSAFAVDVVDDTIPFSVFTVNYDSLNMSVPGTYRVWYSVSDVAGNPATPVFRTVNVVPVPEARLRKK